MLTLFRIVLVVLSFWMLALADRVLESTTLGATTLEEKLLFVIVLLLVLRDPHE